MRKLKNSWLRLISWLQLILFVLSIVSIFYLLLEIFDKLNIKYLSVICYAIILLFTVSSLIRDEKSESDQ